MTILTRYPLLLFVVTFGVLAVAARLGAFYTGIHRSAEDGAAREESSLIINATLTLLALLIGFSFSMAVSRYDQRKQLEAEEANAIGTEYVRASLLPPADAAKVRGLLVRYLEQRIAFYTESDFERVPPIDAATAQLQSELWAAILPATAAQPNPVVALAVSGMNDVLNSQAYSQAAWWNRIPFAAWALMMSIAVFANALTGAGWRGSTAHTALLWVLPLVISVALFLIADLDSPRRGIINVQPQNLISLVDSLRPR